MIEAQNNCMDRYSGSYITAIGPSVIFLLKVVMLFDNIDVLHAVIPHFLHTPEDVQIRENEDAHFFCEVYPDNAPVKWYISGRRVLRTSKYLLPLKGPERQLVIKGATKGDEGRVFVKIADNVQSYADLYVEGMHTDYSY